MIKHLLTSLIVFSLFSFFLTNSHPAFAQTTHRLYPLHILFVEGYILIPSITPPVPSITPTSIPLKSPVAQKTILPTATVATQITPIAIPSSITPIPLKEAVPTAIPTSGNTSDTTTYIMNGINQYRASLGLAKVTTSAQTCDFATTRAKEITTSFSHDGFTSRLNNKTIPYTKWTRITENLATTPQYTEVVNLWINSPEHAKNMRDDTPYVCVIQNGNYYAYEGMHL